MDGELGNLLYTVRNPLNVPSGVGWLSRGLLLWSPRRQCVYCVWWVCQWVMGLGTTKQAWIA
eukprot:1873677-Amphidinium_carterae.1